MSAAAGSPRWQRRIGFRLALMLAVVLLGGYFALPLLWNAALSTLGLPRLDQEIVELSNPEEARLLPLSDMQFIAAQLLSDARPVGPGAWQPAPERAQAIERSLARWGQTYAWLSADREVLACSEGLPFGVGDIFDQPLGHPESETVARAFGDVTLGRILAHVRKGGELAGWLVIYGRPPLGIPGDSAGVLVEAGAPAVRAWSNRVVNLLATAFVVLTALALAFLASRLVTARITRLAQEASVPIDDPRHLPGPFPVEGGDEIAQLAEALNRMRDEIGVLVAALDQRDQDRRRWIAQVSHDLRTPLTALAACIDRAGEELGSAPSLDAARHDVNRLAQLIEDLLDIARLEAGDQPVLEPVPPGELARAALAGLRPLAERDGKRLELDLAPHLPLLEADGRRLLRALENLLRNALHHATSEVTLRVRHEGDHLRFSVEDDGAGFPEDPDGRVDIPGLKDNLSRPDSAGLGLVVVRRIAEAHGGGMAADNRPEGGGRIGFTIPVAGNTSQE